MLRAATHTPLQQPPCSYGFGNGEERPSPSSTHLDCICVTSSPAAPDGQMPETSSRVEAGASAAESAACEK